MAKTQTVKVKVTRAIRTAHRGRVRLFNPGIHDVEADTARRITRALSGSVIRDNVAPVGAAGDAQEPANTVAEAATSLAAQAPGAAVDPGEGAGAGKTPAPAKSPAPAPKRKRKSRAKTPKAG